MGSEGSLPKEPSVKLQAVVHLCPHDFLTEYGYKKIRILGRGMMGQVVLAQPPDGSSDRPLEAVKTFTKKTRDGGKRNFKFFKLEVGILQTAKHPHIMGNIEAFECPDEYTICMPYYKEGSLTTHLPNLTIELTKKYLLQLNSAVLYIHSRRIVHRDIKPHNVLVSDDGNVILSDFGLACGVKAGSCRRPCGTRYYMAPELKGIPLRKNVDLYKCDMYSLGILLCNMIYGRTRAPQGADFLSFIRFQPYVPEFYKNIVDHLLVENPNVRWNAQALMDNFSSWPSMTDLLTALDDSVPSTTCTSIRLLPPRKCDFNLHGRKTFLPKPLDIKATFTIVACPFLQNSKYVNF